jgi:uncharacterized protein YbcI
MGESSASVGIPTGLGARRHVSERKGRGAHERLAEDPSGATLSGISTGLVRVYRDRYGKGPTSAKTHVFGDMVICLLGNIFTPAERTLIDAGRLETVERARSEATKAMRDDLEAVVQRFMGRPVIAHLSQIHTDPDLVAEVFVLGKSDGTPSSQDARDQRS